MASQEQAEDPIAPKAAERASAAASKASGLENSPSSSKAAKPNRAAEVPASAAGPFGGVEGRVGLGIDLVDIGRMAKILQRTPRFATRVYSADEQAYCNSTSRPEAHYATRFAAKEAVLKALGTGFAKGVDPRDIEVRRNVKGRPFVHLSGKAKEIALQQNVRSMPISLSFTHEEAVACALAITQDSLDAMNSRVDVTKEMTRRFKEARAMLDDLDNVGELQKADAAAAGSSRPSAGVTGSDQPAVSAELVDAVQSVKKVDAGQIVTAAAAEAAYASNPIQQPAD